MRFLKEEKEKKKKGVVSLECVPTCPKYTSACSRHVLGLQPQTAQRGAWGKTEGLGKLKDLKSNCGIRRGGCERDWDELPEQN